jgi:hypothetical protein
VLRPHLRADASEVALARHEGLRPSSKQSHLNIHLPLSELEGLPLQRPVFVAVSGVALSAVAADNRLMRLIERDLPTPASPETR